MVGVKAPFVERLMTMLSPEERIALVLRHARQLGDAQIAHRLGCPKCVAVKMMALAEAKVRAAQRALIQAFIEAEAPAAEQHAGRAAPASRKRAKPRAANASAQVARA